MAQAKKNPAKKKTAKGKGNGIRHVKLPFDPGASQETTFTRADLVFTGVDHSDMSYEVRVFLNNRKADHTTPRSAEAGYAGRFVVFGHGNCFGEAGHCEVAGSVQGEIDRQRQHPLTPQTRILTITEPLRGVLKAPKKRLQTLTLVPISKNPNRADCGPTPDLFKYQAVTLRTYR